MRQLVTRAVVLASCGHLLREILPRFRHWKKALAVGRYLLAMVGSNIHFTLRIPGLGTYSGNSLTHVNLAEGDGAAVDSPSGCKPLPPVPIPNSCAANSAWYVVQPQNFF